MYTVNLPSQDGVIYVQQVQPIQEPENRRSRTLIGFGFYELIISVLLFIWCVWAAMVDGNRYIAFIGISCAVLHVVLSVLAIIGGRDVKRNRDYVKVCLVMGIIGCCVFGIATITADALSWTQHIDECHYDCPNNYVTNCSNHCSISPAAIYAPILMFSIIQSIVAVILSSISCYNVCRCCNSEQTQSTVGIPFTHLSDGTNDCVNPK